MNELFQILNMGGYGIYVWSCYAITLLIFGMNFFISFKENRQLKKLIKRKLAKKRYE